MDRSDISDRWLLFKQDDDDDDDDAGNAGGEFCFVVDDDKSLASSVVVPNCRCVLFVSKAFVSVRVHGWDNGRWRTGDSIWLFKEAKYEKKTKNWR